MSTLILLAGFPATGKSYLANLIVERHPAFEIVSQDELKEAAWDEHGFNSYEERAVLEMAAWETYYASLEDRMAAGALVMSDYPFSEKQRPRIEEMARRLGCRVITVRLLGDLDVLYERSRARDLAQSRHLGHMVSCYHKGDVLEDRAQADGFLSRETFMERCTTKGYDSFVLGDLIELDVTDYSQVDYPAVLDRIDELMARGAAAETRSI